MTTPRLAFAFALCAGLLLAAGDPDRGAPDADGIRGIWAARSLTVHGVPVPDDPTRGAVQVAFDGRTFLRMAGERVAAEGRYEVKPGEPSAIDLVIEKGPAAGQRQLGVYQLSGDTLILTLADPGARRRPKSVDARGTSVEVLKKVR